MPQSNKFRPTQTLNLLKTPKTLVLRASRIRGNQSKTKRESTRPSRLKPRDKSRRFNNKRTKHTSRQTSQAHNKLKKSSNGKLRSHELTTLVNQNSRLISNGNDAVWGTLLSRWKPSGRSFKSSLNNDLINWPLLRAKHTRFFKLDRFMFSRMHGIKPASVSQRNCLFLLARYLTIHS